jgi:hypothetical protein
MTVRTHQHAGIGTVRPHPSTAVTLGVNKRKLPRLYAGTAWRRTTDGITRHLVPVDGYTGQRCRDSDQVHARLDRSRDTRSGRRRP